MGIRTNDLPFPNSYWYWIAFWAKGNNFASLVSRQSSVSEVRYPSQKIIMDCEALNPKDKAQSGVDFRVPQMHGKGRWPTLFVDGHASITWYPLYAFNPQAAGGRRPGSGVWQLDPGGPDGWGISGLDGRALTSR